ncbi:MAG: cytidine deaminase [Muribaculaceae bacterium]
MKEVNLNIPVKVVAYDELDEKQKTLVDIAREATLRSYAPYSNFKVGAAIALSNGEVIPGSNQENVAYPSGTCAERSACFYAHARYPEAKFEAIAIAARGTDDEFVETPAAPCGACRQSLLEYETLAGHDVEVILAGAKDIYVLKSVKSLLPLAFDSF